LFRNAAKDEARDNREGDEPKRMQLFRDLGAGSKGEVFALKAGVVQNLEDRRDDLVNIARVREVLGRRLSWGFRHPVRGGAIVGHGAAAFCGCVAE
jgi:hypothetical protein